MQPSPRELQRQAERLLVTRSADEMRHTVHSTSNPARGGGADLTSSGWPDSAAADSTPDIGALPYGAAAVAVGVDGRYVFPDSTLPIAEAGDYSIISNTNQTGFETVNFDGTESSTPNGSISTLKIDSGATGGTAYFDDFYVK